MLPMHLFHTARLLLCLGDPNKMPQIGVGQTMTAVSLLARAGVERILGPHTDAASNAQKMTFALIDTLQRTLDASILFGQEKYVCNQYILILNCIVLIFLIDRATKYS